MSFDRRCNSCWRCGVPFPARRRCRHEPPHNGVAPVFLPRGRRHRHHGIEWPLAWLSLYSLPSLAATCASTHVAASMRLRFVSHMTVRRHCHVCALTHKYAAPVRVQSPGVAANMPQPFARHIAVRGHSNVSLLTVRSVRGGDAAGITTSNQKKWPLAWPFFLIRGGGGGNRTRVRKHSTDSSTYLALPINLTLTTRTCTLRQGELP